VVQAFLQPGPCLVVGDAPGDPDCFCSAVALARTRRALGLPGEAHVDAVAPRQVQGILQDGEVVGAARVRALAPETVVLVDNDGTRVGPAAAEAMRGAKRVVVIDHHDVDPTHERLGLPPETELVVWKDTGADAAALMALGTAVRAASAAQVSLRQDTWQSILEPLVGAIYSDTRGFEAGRTRPATMHVLMRLLDTRAVRLKTTLAGFGEGVSADVRRALYAAIQEQGEVHGRERLGVFTLSGSALLTAWQAAQAQVPELTWSDALFMALDHVEARVREAGYHVSVFITGARDADAERRLYEAALAQLPRGAVKFSVRTTEGALAPALAQHLGGGGKPHEGGGVSEAPAHALVQQVQRWMRGRAELARHAARFNLGSL
jgi:nanoRNase/pAp phosphatase (c-di-AMP/oligoRNAs hydrolase)